MGGKCFRESGAASSSLNDSSSLDSSQTGPEQESAARTESTDASPLLMTQPEECIQSSPAPKLRKAKNTRRGHLKPWSQKARNGEEKSAAPELPPRNYVIDCRVSINPQDVRQQYEELRLKTAQLFSPVTSTSKGDDSRSQGKRRNRRGNKQKVSEGCEEVPKTMAQKSEVVETSQGQNVECESFSSKTTDDASEASTGSPNLRKKRVYRCRAKSKKQSAVHYVKKQPNAPAKFMDRLNSDISAQLAQCSSFYSSTLPLCTTLQTYIQSLARTTFQNNTICAVMYGSMATGFAYEGSDLDLAISGLSIGTKEALIDSVCELTDRLVQLPFVVSCQPITTARVPIIKLYVNLELLSNGKRKGELKVDVTFEDSVEGIVSDVHYGLKCTALMASLTARHAYLRDTVILLKKLLHTKELNVSYLGGMNSFTLTLFVSAFMCGSPEFPTVGDCFMAVLQYFGKVFDPETMIIMQDCIAVAPNYSCDGSVVPFVSDPFRLEENAARNVTRFAEIAASFSCAYDRLYEEWDREAVLAAGSLLSSIFTQKQ